MGNDLETVLYIPDTLYLYDEDQRGLSRRHRARCRTSEDTSKHLLAIYTRKESTSDYIAKLRAESRLQFAAREFAKERGVLQREIERKDRQLAGYKADLQTTYSEYRKTLALLTTAARCLEFVAQTIVGKFLLPKDIRNEIQTLRAGINAQNSGGVK